MNEDAVVAQKIQSAKRGYFLTLGVFWLWLVVGITDPFGNMYAWYAVYMLLALANVVFVFRRSIAEGGWKMDQLIPNP